MKRNASCILVLLVLALTIGVQPGSAQSRTGTANWDNLQQLLPGAEIRVALTDRKSVRGQFQSVTGDSLVITTPTSQETLARELVTRVWSKRESHRRRNVLRGLRIGLGIGAGIGVLAGVAAGQLGYGAGEVTGIVALGVGEGAGLGAAIGAVVPTGGWREVYRTRAR